MTIVFAIIAFIVLAIATMILRGFLILDSRVERESRARGYRVYNAAPGAIVPQWKRVDE